MGYVVDNISFTILMITVLMANKSVNLATLVDNIPYEIGVLNDLLDVLSVIKESMGFRNYNNSQMLYFNSFVHDLLVKVDLVNRNYKNLNLNQFSGLAWASYEICLQNLDLIVEKKVTINSNIPFCQNNFYLNQIREGVIQQSYLSRYLQTNVHIPHDLEIWTKNPQPPVPWKEFTFLSVTILIVGVVAYNYFD